MTAQQLISSMGWEYENTETSARFVAEHAVKTMYSEDELNDMFETLRRNSVDNVATITDVNLFINSWKKEFKNNK
jgi:D-arabinose 1-dehydrogenase-like Zn-dependent alcohol dehydrogenase